MSGERPLGLTAITGESRIIVCCGSGGVGKTTAAAAIALEAARRGRRACVVTIDPAKRLADALGLDSLTNEPKLIDGDWPGQLWALMLDTKTTFDSLVSRYAGEADQAQRILDNRLYRNMSGALSGTQEYMAMEKLFELNEAGRFDVVVVDTPPTRNALDFLDAPRRLTRFLDNRIFRMLVMPTRTYLKAVGLATQAFLRTVSKVVGSEVVSDAMAFFQAFDGMEEGFRTRAQAVLDLLAAETTSFVLVASPRRDAVAEALYFGQRLAESGIDVEALIVNRVHPRFGPGATPAEESGDPRLRALVSNLADFREIARREESHLLDLTQQVDPAPVYRVPMLGSDVHDIAGLTEVASHLFADS